MTVTEADLFAAIDARPETSMVAFDSKALAMRFIAHRQKQGDSGCIAMVEDTRTNTGLCVMWITPLSFAEVEKHQAHCRWLLEEILAGRQARPVPGEVHELWLKS